MAKRDPKLSVGRGDKLPVSRGAGLTEKGREKYNRETGSNLKAPTKDKSNPRHKSFCARMQGVVENAEGDAPRARASLKRWGCATGGTVTMSKVNHYSGGAPIAEAEDKAEKFAKGGMKRKSGGKCGGDMPAKRLDKRARGGGVMSSAANVKQRTGGKCDED